MTDFKSKLFLILLVAAMGMASCDTEKEIEVPAEVKSSFAELYPNAEDVSWEKKRKTYEANFVMQGQKREVEFGPSGDKQEEELIIGVEELPQSIRDYIEEHHGSLFIAEVSIESENNVDIYEVELKKANFKTIELEFDIDGKLIGDDEFSD